MYKIATAALVIIIALSFCGCKSKNDISSNSSVGSSYGTTSESSAKSESSNTASSDSGEVLIEKQDSEIGKITVTGSSKNESSASQGTENISSDETESNNSSESASSDTDDGYTSKYY